jgi:hypothetical protein
MNSDEVHDKAEWHYGGDYPADLPQEQAFVHTGMFLGWLIDHDLFSDWFGQELKDYIYKFKNRELTGAKVFEASDGVLVADMLSDEGNSFAQHYFDFERGRFLRDYNELLGGRLPTLYHVRDTWRNYEKLKKRIDRRYRKWKNDSQPGLIKRWIQRLKKSGEDR